MAELFPRTSVAFPDIADWEHEFDWGDFGCRGFAMGLIDNQVSLLEEAGGPAFEAYCDCVAADVGVMADDRREDAVSENIDAFRILFAMRPMQLTLAWGRSGDTYGWIMWSVARGAERGQRVFEFVPRLIPKGWQAADDYMQLVVGELGDWTASFYLCARKFGGLDALARLFAELCFGVCSRELIAGRNVEQNFSALVMMSNWASNADEPQAEEWVHFVSGRWPGPLSSRNRAELGTLLITRAHRFTLKDAQWWANKMLRDWRPILTEHLEVQFLAVSLRTMDDWRGARIEILDAIVRLARFYTAADDPSRSSQQALESRVAIIQPLIYFLTENGSSNDILDLLGAWYSPSGQRECDGEVLVVAAGHPQGVRYLWPGGMLQIKQEPGADTYNSVLAAASDALREYYRATDLGDQPVGFDVNRMGIPDEAAAAPFEAALRAHYRVDLLAAALPAGMTFRSTLTIPSTPVPISAMLATEVGISAPAEASLRQSRAIREVRRVSVWSGGMMHGQFELEALGRTAELAGWEMSVHAEIDDGIDAFRGFYSDPDADVLWVIGHGEHSPYRMDQTGLHLGGGRLLSAAEIGALPIPGECSRLLVLNVCSGATTQVLGGIARLGLSQELVEPNQQVLAHLWPIGIYAGLAFGAMFGLELSRRDRAAAYGATVAALRDPPRLREELRQSLGADLAIHGRLEQHDDQVGGLLSWGAPVLLT
jgi:CHAT domain